MGLVTLKSWWRSELCQVHTTGLLVWLQAGFVTQQQWLVMEGRLCNPQPWVRHNDSPVPTSAMVTPARGRMVVPCPAQVWAQHLMECTAQHGMVLLGATSCWLGSPMLRLRGSSQGWGGRCIYLISCTLLPLSFCIARKKGSSLGRGREMLWAMPGTTPHCMSCLGLAMALGDG